MYYLFIEKRFEDFLDWLDESKTRDNSSYPGNKKTIDIDQINANEENAWFFESFILHTL